MNPLARAALKTALIDPALVAELRRWYGVPEDVEIPPMPALTVSAVTQILEEALQSEELVLLRETNLNILNQYLQTQAPAKLSVADDSGKVVDIALSVGRTPTGEFVIPWKSESIKDLMVDDRTVLILGDDSYYFSDVYELYFGAVKAFMVCTPCVVAQAVQPLLGASSGNPS